MGRTTKKGRYREHPPCHLELPPKSISVSRSVLTGFTEETDCGGYTEAEDHTLSKLKLLEHGTHFLWIPMNILWIWYLVEKLRKQHS